MAQEEEDSGETVYVYRIPLVKDSDGSKSSYKPSTKGDVLLSRYGSKSLLIAQTSPTPHHHKDESAVSVEKMTLSEFKEEFNR